MSPPTELLQGTLDLLILKALVLGPNHGLGIARRVQQLTKNTFTVGAGSLFPALHRLEDKGWLASAWGESEHHRRAKYYTLTRTGRRQLKRETEQWNRIVLAMAMALEG
jgi:PadR family transcriptional regulator PadR